MPGADTTTAACNAITACVAISSALTPDAVVTALCMAASVATTADYAAFVELDAAGTPVARLPAEADAADASDGRRLIDRLLTGRGPRRLERSTTDAHAAGLPAGEVAEAAVLAVPVGGPRLSHGILYLTRDAGREFTDDDQRLADLLASQATIALENARLLHASRRWLRELEALREIGDALVSALDLDEMLRVICARARELCDAEVAQVFLPDAAGEHLESKDALGDRAETFRGLRVRIGSSKVGAVFTRGRPARVDDALADPEINRMVARRSGIRSCIYAPITVHDRTLGVIVCVNRQGGERVFSDADLRVLELLADRAGVALHMASRIERDVYEAVREREVRQRAIFESLDTGVLVVDRDRTVVDCNPALERISGLTRDELLDSSLDDPPLEVVDEQSVPVTPDRFAASMSLASGAGQRGSIAGIRRRDGTLVWVRRNAEPIILPGEATPSAVVVTFAELPAPGAA